MLTMGTGKSTFQMELKQLIPGVFYKFRDINTITVVATCTFKDKKGQESRGDVMRAKFTRDNADSINWGNIDSDNLPTIADDYWVHQ